MSHQIDKAEYMGTENTKLAPMDSGQSRRGLLDFTITLRQIRKCFLFALSIAAVWYVLQFIRLEWHNKTGGLAVQSSPYYVEIPDDCKTFSDRHVWHRNTQDSIALRIRGIRLREDYLQTGYGGIRCLGYAVLTGLHMQDPLDADFTDTYTDREGNPIVRITVEYLQTFTYDPIQRKPLAEAEKK